MKKHFQWLGIGMLLVLMAASTISCASTGRKFPVEPVARIVIGLTTQQDIQRMFGNPWSVGIENGMKTWTYGDYHWSAFSETSRTDLVVRFKDDGTVASYTFNTTDPEYMNKMR